MHTKIPINTWEYFREPHYNPDKYIELRKKKQY